MFAAARDHHEGQQNSERQQSSRFERDPVLFRHWLSPLVCAMARATPTRLDSSPVAFSRCRHEPCHSRAMRIGGLQQPWLIAYLRASSGSGISQFFAGRCVVLAVTTSRRSWQPTRAVMRRHAYARAQQVSLCLAASLQPASAPQSSKCSAASPMGPPKARSRRLMRMMFSRSIAVSRSGV